MSRRLKPTLADYVVLAINPVLIMGLVGSLIYFLLELLYGGRYPDRLQFCLTMFVFAIVLISRISMEDGFERAAPFGIALAVVVGIALNRFVDYHGEAAESYAWIINWSLMALTWWCAHKLTWDCTTIDETAEASGRGLLETAGIDPSSDDPADHPPPVAAQPAPANLPPPSELSQKKWQQLLDRPRRPHVPGVWIVYFSLASLPIFGLGQLFIPAENTASRRYVFLLLCVYVACGLALLLTTSFLSLRRYLRTRRLEMPAAMAGNWLAIGGVMVVGLLLFSALLPRPAPEYAISALTGQIDSADHSAAPISAGSEGVRDREAGSDSGIDHSAQQPSDQPDPSAGADTRNTSTGPDGQTPGKSGSPSSDKGDSGSAAKSPQQSNEKPAGESDEKSDNNTGQPAESKTSPPPDAKAQSQQAQPQQTSPQSNPPQAADKPPSDQPPSTAPPPAPANNSPPPPPPAPPLPNLGSMFGSLAGILKLALYAVLICGVAYGAWRSRAELLEIIAGWLAALRAFWRSFFVDPDSPEEAEGAAQHQPQSGWSFSDFVDPFARGTAQNSSPAELVKYTFAALEAWGREQGFPRGPDETPHEFVALLGSKIPQLRPDSLVLANLYSRAVYSQASLPPAAIANLSQLWRLMHSARAEQPATPG